VIKQTKFLNELWNSLDTATKKKSKTTLLYPWIQFQWYIKKIKRKDDYRTRLIQLVLSKKTRSIYFCKHAVLGKFRYCEKLILVTKSRIMPITNLRHCSNFFAILSHIGKLIASLHYSITIAASTKQKLIIIFKLRLIAWKSFERCIGQAEVMYRIFLPALRLNKT